MPAEAVSSDLKKNRPFLFLQKFAFAPVRINHGKRVIAVDPFRMHLPGIHAGTDAGSHAVSHGFAACLSSHTILVVHDVYDDWQYTFSISLPQLFKLVHRGKGNTFPDGTAGQAGIADIGYP